MARNSSLFQTLKDDDKKKRISAFDLIGDSTQEEAYQKRIFNRQKADTFKEGDDVKIAKTQRHRLTRKVEELGISARRYFGRKDDTTELKNVGEQLKTLPSRLPKQGFALEARDKMDQKSRQKKLTEANNAWRDTFLDIEQAKKDLDGEILRLQGSIASQGQPLRDMGKPLTIKEETEKLEKKVLLMGGKDQLENKGAVNRGTFVGNVATTQRQVELLEESKESLQLLREYSGEIERKGGFLSGITSAMKDERDAVKTFVPFGGDIYSTLELVHDAKELKKVQEKLANGEDLTITEKTFYKRYQNELLSQMIKRGVAYDVGKTIASLPKYALEFAITGGIATGITKGLGRVGAKSALTKTLETASKEGVRKTIGSVTRQEAKNIGVDLVRSSIANAGRTGIGFSPTISRKTAEFMSDDMALVQGEKGDMVLQKVGEGDSFWKALTKAYASTYVEVGAESAGIFAEVPLSRAKVGVMSVLGKHITEPDKFIQKAILAKFASKKGIVSAEQLSKLTEKIGWNGIIPEVFEEELTELAQAPIEEREYYPLWTPQGMERFLVETMAIGAFGGLGAVARAPITTGGIDTMAGKKEEEMQPTQKPVDGLVFDLEKEGIEIKDKGQEQPIEQLDEGNTTIEEQVLPQESVTEETQESEPTKDELNEVLGDNDPSYYKDGNAQGDFERLRTEIQRFDTVEDAINAYKTISKERQKTFTADKPNIPNELKVFADTFGSLGYIDKYNGMYNKGMTDIDVIKDIYSSRKGEVFNRNGRAPVLHSKSVGVGSTQNEFSNFTANNIIARSDKKTTNAKPILKTTKERALVTAPTSRTSKARPSESQIGQVMQELDASEAGERFRTSEGDWMGKNSTFPDWITSPDIRDRGVVDKVLGYLRSGKEPPERFGKIRALYDMALEEAQTREADVEADKEIEQDKKDAIKKKKANEIKVGDVSTSKDRKIATTKPVEAKGKIRESRAFQNVKERLQDVTEDDPTYNQMDLADNAVKAVEFVRKYPKRAEKISMGMELPPSGMTQTAITLAYSEALGLTGKHAKRVQVEKVLSLTMTRLGQEIVSLRGRINTDSSPYFIQKVLEARKNLLASGWKLPSYVQKIGGKPIETNSKKVAMKISDDAKTLKSKIDAKVLEDLGSAQAFIDSITC